MGHITVKADWSSFDLVFDGFSKVWPNFIHWILSKTQKTTIINVERSPAQNTKNSGPTRLNWAITRYCTIAETIQIVVVQFFTQLYRYFRHLNLDVSIDSPWRNRTWRLTFSLHKPTLLQFHRSMQFSCDSVFVQLEIGTFWYEYAISDSSTVSIHGFHFDLISH